MLAKEIQACRHCCFQTGILRHRNVQYQAATGCVMSAHDFHPSQIIQPVDSNGKNGMSKQHIG